MLMDTKVYGVKEGQTTEALEQVTELLLSGHKVLYLSDELTYSEIKRRLLELSEDSPLFNLKVLLLLEVNKAELEGLLADEDTDVVIVLDTLINYGDIICEQPLYVYHQEK